jgi:hypothetical protein
MKKKKIMFRSNQLKIKKKTDCSIYIVLPHRKDQADK